MWSRSTRLVVIAPLIDGVVADLKEHVHAVIRAGRAALTFQPPRDHGVLSGGRRLSSGLVDRRRTARIRTCLHGEEGLAAACDGVSSTIFSSAVVDIGAGTTNVAAIVTGRSLPHGRKELQLRLEPRYGRCARPGLRWVPTAERLKLELSSAIEPKDPHQKMEVRGRDVQTGSPGAVNVSVAEVHAVTLPIIRRIADLVRNTLTELPAEVSGDIYDRGLILTGGGALLEGMGQYLQKEVGLAVVVADDPRLAIVRGLSQMFDEPLLLRGWRAGSNSSIDVEKLFLKFKNGSFPIGIESSSLSSSISCHEHQQTYKKHLTVLRVYSIPVRIDYRVCGSRA